MANFLLYEATKCGICLRPVEHSAGTGTHTLVELDLRGMRVPHRCPEPDVDRWMATIDLLTARPRPAFRLVFPAGEGGDP